VGGGRFHGQESGAHVEDLMHFMLECPAYDDIRSRFPRIFGVVGGPDPSVRLRSIFCGDHQEQLAACLFSMNEFRSECLKPAPPNPGGGGRGGTMIGTVYMLYGVCIDGVGGPQVSGL
jgi:hypothetical protein